MKIEKISARIIYPEEWFEITSAKLIEKKHKLSEDEYL